MILTLYTSAGVIVRKHSQWATAEERNVPGLSEAGVLLNLKKIDMMPGISKQRDLCATCGRELTLARSALAAPGSESGVAEASRHSFRSAQHFLTGLVAVAVFASPAVGKGAPSKAWKVAIAAHLRAAPSGGSPVVAVIPKNALVASAVPCAGVWCAVEYEGKRGYLYRPYLAEPAPAAPTPARALALPEQPAKEASLKFAPAPVESAALAAPTDEGVSVRYSLIGLSAEGFLPMREGPLDSARVVGVLSSSSSGIVDMKTNVRQWRLVEHNGVKGYVQSRFLARLGAAPAQRYGVAGAGNLEVFNFGAADADVVGEIPFYADGIVPIGECNAEWCHIRYLGLTGFVDMHGLRPETGPEG
jgi:SH3-like domain-containing protein